jgi:hypothetical protein
MMPSSKKLVKSSAEDLKPGSELDMIYGAAKIGARLNMNRRSAYLNLEAGRIEGAFKLGRTWAISGAKLRKVFIGEAPPSDV